MDGSYSNGASGNPGVSNTSTYFTPPQPSNPFFQQLDSSADAKWSFPNVPLAFPCENCFTTGADCDMISPCWRCRQERYGGCPDGTGKFAQASFSPFDRSFKAKLYGYVKYTATESAAAKQQGDMLEGQVVELSKKVVVLEGQKVELERRVAVLEGQMAKLRELLPQKSSCNTPRESIPQNDTQYGTEVASWIQP